MKIKENTLADGCGGEGVTGDMDIPVVELVIRAIELIHEVNISASEVGVAREDSLVESDLESIVGWMTELLCKLSKKIIG